ncbi:MAG: Arm DNA-binding domain-containing protein, partial [Alphaproteobacteria bacterium]|nr:Arm DNA-binding domain-containing protein [Alphaproteobacteria bacterium]
MAEKIRDNLMREGLEPPPAGRSYAITWDTDIKGFGALITKAGHRAFVLRYRNKEGRDRRYPIGTYLVAGASPTARPEMSVEAARRKAKALKAEIRDGGDPSAEKQQVRETAKELREAPTLRVVFDDYLKREFVGNKGNASAAGVRRAVFKEMADYLDTAVQTIEDKDIHKRLESIRDGDPKKKLMARPYL